MVGVHCDRIAVDKLGSNAAQQTGLPPICGGGWKRPADVCGNVPGGVVGGIMLVSPTEFPAYGNSSASAPEFPCGARMETASNVTFFGGEYVCNMLGPGRCSPPVPVDRASLHSDTVADPISLQACVDDSMPAPCVPAWALMNMLGVHDQRLLRFLSEPGV